MCFFLSAILFFFSQSLKEFFVKEWKGIGYKIYTACPSCQDDDDDVDGEDDNGEDEIKKAPFLWKLDVDRVYYDEQVVSCRFEEKIVDKWLVFPPPCKC